MGKTLIKIDCVDQRLIISNNPLIAAGGQNEDQIEFSFCPLWDNFEKTAVFYRDENAVYHVPLVDDKCVIPHEVLADEGWVYFGVFGTTEDARRTSAIAKYRIERGAITGYSLPSDPSNDIYARYLEQILRAEKAAENAEKAAENAEKAAKNAEKTVAELTAFGNEAAVAETERVEAEKQRAETFAGFEGEINQISEEIDDLFCEIGKYFKLDLLNSVYRHQGSINTDGTINGTRMNRVVFKIPLDRNKSYYFSSGSLMVVDVIVRDAGGASMDNALKQTNYVSVYSADTDCTLMVSLRRDDDGELLVSDKLLDNCHMYESVQKANIDVSSLLRRGYYSFTQKAYVDSDTRVCLQCDIDLDSTYRVIASDDVVLREMVVYADEYDYATIFSSSMNKEAFIFPEAYTTKRKVQIILARTNPNDTITLSDCANLIFEEVY